jgi:hypothetical protein
MEDMAVSTGSIQEGNRMRKLTQEEVEEGLDDNGESDDGYIPIEASIQELADMGVSTCCGRTGNKCFKALADKGYEHRKCRGWFCEKPFQMTQETYESIGGKGSVPIMGPDVAGMFHIKIQTDKTAEKISRIAGEAGGSLRLNGDSLWEGFKEFEIE